MIFTKKEAIAQLPVIDEPKLANAVNIALWMIFDKGSTLKNALKASAMKHGTSQVDIDRLIRAAIPKEFFWDRSREAWSRTGGKSSPSYATRARKLKKVESDNIKHFKDITL